MPLFTLADIDGTKPGRACLVSIDLDKPGEPMGGPTFAEFTEGVSKYEPVTSCFGLWSSIVDDWPQHRFVIIANERARYLIWKEEMGPVRAEQPEEQLLNRYLGILNRRPSKLPTVVT